MIIDEWNAYGGPDNMYDTEFTAAFQAAAMHRMLEGGLAAQTFFAFWESCPEFADKSGSNWGMLTRQDAPKASYHSFEIFAGLTGKRLTVSGGDGQVGAVAVATVRAST